MPITDVFVLPSDVMLIPVGDLPSHVRDKLTYKEGDHAITRPHVRSPSKIIDANAVSLLRQFEQPKTIVAAVLSFSQQTAADPEKVLEQALPFLKNLIDARVLLEGDSPGTDRIQPSLSPGDMFAEFEIVTTVHVVDDTEVFQARHALTPDSPVALKIGRPRSGVDLSETFSREAEVLRRLDGSVAPRLVLSGVHDGRPFIAMDWIEGVPAPIVVSEVFEAIAADANQLADQRARLQDLAVRVAESYATLHEQGVLHSDVHANNLLVRPSGEVAIIDFGYARLMDEREPLALAPRGGVGFYFEPECALAIISRQLSPLSTASGEQYSVGAIIYQLLTGDTHLDFSLQYEEMLRQIAHSDARAWAALGVPEWPEMEEAVQRALRRDPAERFPTMRAFAAALRAARPASLHSEPSPTPERVLAAKPSAIAQVPASYGSFIARVLRRLEPDQALFNSPIEDGASLPTASANHGAAGIAYAVLRLAARREDPALLALADAWITKTIVQADHERAFYNETLEITKETVSAVSFHHMPPGVFFVRALISLAMADVATAQSAIDAFVDTSQGDTDNLDLTLGRASVMHGATLLLDQAQLHRRLDVTRLRQCGDKVLAELWARLDTFGPVATSKELTYLGVAHGWAGLLYGTLRWCELSARQQDCDIATLLPSGFRERLQQLAACAKPSGRGLVWTWFNQAAESTTDAGCMPGWCNGNAGHVFLWTLAYQVFGEQSYRALAEQAAWGIVEQRTHFNNLCCGATGCAYAMLSLYRATADESWLQQARRYADRVATIPDPPSERPSDVDSLYKGDIGAIVLLDDMSAPEQSRMPLFE